ncbi:hypothetical protein METBIDRAFT_17472, partial [Metschnikowia bicuspidata var. bicuspidata NRRL YB-4993]
LPLVWNQTLMDNKYYMFGFSRFALCTFYVTDLVLVWADTPATEDIYKKALERGISGFDEEKRSILMCNLAAAVSESPSHIRFSCPSLQTIAAEVKLSENLSWSFNADLCDSRVSSDFFRGLCCQSLANHGLSLYRGFQMENMIRTRDEYILYLEENYKTVNGTELMSKYRRQHAGSASILLRYSKE